MLNKKYQVLLSNWMEDYIKYTAEKYDLNFSSTIRVYMCLGILYIISILEPDYKTNIQSKELTEPSKKASQNELKEEEVHQLLSKVIFETRKAVEYRLSKEESKKSNR